VPGRWLAGFLFLLSGVPFQVPPVIGLLFRVRQSRFPACFAPGLGSVPVLRGKGAGFLLLAGGRSWFRFNFHFFRGVKMSENISVFYFKILFLDDAGFPCGEDGYRAEVEETGVEGEAREIAGDLVDEYAESQLFHYDAEDFETTLVDAG